MNDRAKLRIAHLSGAAATIQNTPPLVTSNKARLRHGLPPRLNRDGSLPQFDGLRAQRLAAPAKVYVEQFSAHPLEGDAAELYGPPDGYLGTDGQFRKVRVGSDDKPVYEIELHPDDGLYPLPYMALQADGRAWEEECAYPGAPSSFARQGFFPDGSRGFEEIDRLSLGADGMASQISSRAVVDFYRSAPPAGFTKGLAAHLRTDMGAGDISQEVLGKDFYPYKPYHLASSPTRPVLARETNDMQAIALSGAYDGIIWTQGSPQIEETAYWFNLLIDTTLPICGCAAQRPQGQISADGPKNLLDAVEFISSRAWADDQGRNRFGVVLAQDQQFFAAREVAKVDARPGGFNATGGHGGIIGQVTHRGRIHLTYLPVYKHTYTSELRLTKLPSSVKVVRRGVAGIDYVDLAIKDSEGRLLADAIPIVSIMKDGSYSGIDFGDDPELEVDLMASINHKLDMGLLAGFVVEGLTPYGITPSQARHKALIRASFCGMPVVKVGRGTPEGFADPHEFQIAASNLTATKARLLLMASLLKLGSLPPARDPDSPTVTEIEALKVAVAKYQAIFESH
ncbi:MULTISPECIES: asparaginase domain-containing protein [unclassified Beijerinckia]|uniref:asparaginase domain-containing protein n=1 Tax=unclassified Beijerinckia TaxID=2638183 RepID=UPI000894B9A1|nr:MULTISPECIES: asparaginase domain-containing protein [unclassified Beijerinckia]MDH7799217.1 L-asparaginase [Beijerinckia sp. GAS462]SED91676.1 Asparaginase [Beijerinckia sp. 28-YEA-48]